MKIGDLVLFSDDKWLVRNYDKMTRTVVLCNQTGDKRELPVDMDVHTPDQIQVLCNPGLQWHVLAVKVKPNAGPFIRAEAPAKVPGASLTFRPRPLANWEDWIPSDPFREGGSVFINPSFGLRTGDLVLFTHRNGSQSRMIVPGNFGTVASARTAKIPIKKPEVNRFTHILDDDDDE
jgi:hypothetical protein